jgi:tetratricopeptide (TPR) repeat protein
MAGKMSRAELDRLLSQISSEEGRVEAIRRLLGRAEIPEDYVNSAIEFCEKADRLGDAIDIARQAGRADRVVGLLEKSGRLLAAARFARQSGMADRSRDLFERVVNHLDSRSEFVNAAKVAREAGLPERSAELLDRAIKQLTDGNRILEASNLALEAGLAGRAVEILEAAGRFRDAAKTARDAGLTERAIAAYQKAGQIKEAVQAAVEADQVEKAIEICEAAGNFTDAARLAERAGAVEWAVDLYEKAEMFGVAAETARDNGMIERAIELYRRAGRDEDARALGGRIIQKDADGARKRRDLEMAEREGDFQTAARLARELGLADKAAAFEALIGPEGEGEGGEESPIETEPAAAAEPDVSLEAATADDVRIIPPSEPSSGKRPSSQRINVSALRLRRLRRRR